MATLEDRLAKLEKSVDKLVTILEGLKGMSHLLQKPTTTPHATGGAAAVAEGPYTEGDEFFVDYSLRNSTDKEATRQELYRLGYPDHLLRASQVPSLSGGGYFHGNAGAPLTETDEFFVNHSLHHSKDKEQTTRELAQLGFGQLV